jgi:simple sugar transport system permease protein
MNGFLSRDFFTRNETLVALVIVAFCVVATISDPNFFSVTTLSDLLRASIVLGILAVAAMLVLVSGGIDVSFTAVAVSAMYMTTVFTLAVWPEMPWPLIFLISIGIGALLGAINGIFIAGFGLPTLIVTLGTLSVFRGFLLTFVGSQRISDLPPEMRGFSRLMIVRGDTPGGDFYALPWAFAGLVIAVVLTWFILHRTMLGRSIFALGGSVESARRIGINVRRTQFFVYVYVGALSGLAGIIHGAMSRMADPFSLVGQELSVIAAVVLGGARLIGGYGTLTGTLLGVALIVLVQNSLIVIGIPSTWQSVAIGLLILIGTGVPAWQAKRAAARAA